MRIEKIRIENLNSLYGVNEIDLTVKEYRENNLFLLWGNTGAGKTTVLDAITLALYGQTARLGSPNKSIKTDNKKISENELLSKGAKCCSAKVTFSLNGVRYRASWSQEVNRNGNLNGAVRTLEKIGEDGDKGEIIVSGLDPVGKAIPALIGLNYDQFTKAVLLEQGGFSQFLKADRNERSAILEQLTATTIYSDLSIAAFNCEKDANQHCKDIENRLAGIQAMSAEDVEAQNKRLKEITAETASLDGAIKELNAADKWYKDCEERAKRCKDIRTEQDEHREKCVQFAPERAKLELGERASAIESLYCNFIQARENLQKERANLDAKRESLPRVESALQEARQKTESSRNALDKARQDWNENEPIINQVRELKNDCRRIADELKQLWENDGKAEHEKREAEQKLGQSCERIDELTRRLNNAEVYFTENAVDEHLLREFEAIKVQKDLLESSVKSLESADKAREKAQKDYDKSNKEYEASVLRLRAEEEKYKGIAESLHQAERTFLNACDGSKLEDLQSHLEDLKDSKRLHASVENLRLELHEGQKCPLCGSLEHPDCSGLSSKISEIDVKIGELDKRIKAILDAQKQKDEACRQEREAQVCLDKLKNAVSTLENAARLSLENLNEKKETLEAARADSNSILKILNEKLEKYGEQADVAHVAEICSKLEKRCTLWQNGKKAQKEFEDELNKEKQTQVRLSACIEEISKKQAENKVAIEAKSAEMAARQAEIESIFGKRDVETEAERLKSTLRNAEKAQQDDIAQLHQKETEYEKLKVSVAECENNVRIRTQESEAAQMAFVGGLQKQQFADEKSFTDARLSEKQIAALRQEAKKLDDETARLDAGYKEAETSLNQLREHPVTGTYAKAGMSIEAIQCDLASYKDKLNANNEEIGRIREKLDKNRENDAKIGEMGKELEQARSEHKRWEALSKLIGSSDGKKFRNFAQGLTFNILLRNANKYLRDKELMKRYELVRKSSDDMSLDFVVQDYHTGQIRPVSNLSGGEQFCMSLALALALSEMASRNVAIESLFIDEGLGTLDDNTLDTAIDMLKNLGDSKRSRLVGLITHVARAHEIVDTQIVVEKIGESGCSRLVGPGCQRL